MAYDPIKVARAMARLPVLRKGSVHPAVRLLKRCLAVHLVGREDWGDYNAEIGDRFDEGVAHFVREYQSMFELKVDAIVGPATWASLLDEAPREPSLAGLRQAPPGALQVVIVENAVKAEGLRIREKSGRNDGPLVEAILATADLKAGQPWCVAFCWAVYAFSMLCLDRYAQPWPLTAKRSATWLVKAAQRGEGGLSLVEADKVQPGDLFVIPGKHAGIVVGLPDARRVETVEGNTNKAGSAEGDGVYRKTRSRAGNVFVRVS